MCPFFIIPPPLFHLIHCVAGLQNLAEEITNEASQVGAVVEEGRQLCKHTSGDEAVALQSQLEALRLRYGQLNKAADARIERLQEALPLAESFHGSHARIADWLDHVEDDLNNIDTVPIDQQALLISNIVEDCEQLRGDVDAVTSEGARLGQLCSNEDATNLAQMSSQLNRRFDAVSDRVQRRAERLQLAKERSGQVLGDVEELLDWMTEAERKLSELGAASADAATVRRQLSDQRLFNDDIAGQRARLRDALAAARRLAHDFNTDADHPAAADAHNIESIADVSYLLITTADFFQCTLLIAASERAVRSGGPAQLGPY